MTIQRSLFAGGTDYTGAPLEDILEHFRTWKMALEADLEMIENLRARVAQLSDRNNKAAGVDFLNYFHDRFSRYVGDFDRLLSEVPHGVHERHVAIVEQLCVDAGLADDSCVRFKQRNNLEAVDYIGDDPLALLALIYVRVRDSVVDLFDLCNIVPRLRTFVGTPLSLAHSGVVVTEALELKPNVFGVGLNLNYILDWLLRHFKRRERR